MTGLNQGRLVRLNSFLDASCKLNQFFFMFTALTDSSVPWSITFIMSSFVTRDKVNCKPPVPHPLAMGISRLARGLDSQEWLWPLRLPALFLFRSFIKEGKIILIFHFNPFLFFEHCPVQLEMSRSGAV